jgi:glycosyltransferase involved in cell wall biosynthesis
MVELVRAAPALFDPLDTRSIADALERGLEDEGLRARMLAEPLGAEHSWEAVADRTADAYDSLRPGKRPRRCKPRVAYVSPLPPHASGIADYSYRLLAELRHSCSVDAFTDTSFGSPNALAGVRIADIRTFDVVEAVRGGYDRVFVCIGNSEHHVAALDFLRRRSGIVLAHDVRLTGLYAWAANRRPDAQPRSFAAEIERMYGVGLREPLGAGGFLDPAEAQRQGLLMAREVLGLSKQYLVHSAYAAQLARLEARFEDQAKVRVVPFGFETPAGGSSSPKEPPVVASFGIVASVKQPAKLLAAFSRVLERHPRARLVFVGVVPEPRVEAQLRTRALEQGIAHRVNFTAYLTDADFRGSS